MKRQVYLTIAIMIIGVVFAAAAEAQTLGSQTMRARIPFAFTVGQKTLPAGDYRVSILNPTSDRKALQIRSDDGRFSAIIQTSGVDSTLVERSKLVFRRYGDRYFFAQAQLAGDSTSLAAARTSAERATQKSLKRNWERTVVAIAAE